MRKLAAHPDLKISGVLLKDAVAVSDEEIAAIASAASHTHLLVIASRDSIDEKVTDALINRGDVEAMRTFAANDRARVSHVGFVKLINAAKRRQFADRDRRGPHRPAGRIEAVHRDAAPLVRAGAGRCTERRCRGGLATSKTHFDSVAIFRGIVVF